MTILGAAVVVAMLSVATAALAAELPAGPYYTAPATLSASSWAGPYLGATLGYKWDKADNNPIRPSGIESGIEAGYNGQIGQLVVGIQTDISVSGSSDTFAPWQFSNPWFGTSRGRAGAAFGNVLFYGTGGVGYGSLTATTLGNLSETHTSLGWTAGIGAEVGFMPHWSAKAEWLYLDLADRSFSVTGNQ